MNKMQQVDRIFRSSFDELVESFFQQPQVSETEKSTLPLSNIGDYIDIYKEKKSLESKVRYLKDQMLTLTAELQAIEIKERELKRNEQSLKEERTHLREACESKSLFLANMTHEIRTPMNGVIGTLEILKETSLSPDQKKYLGIIETCAHTLLSLVNDVLDYSKIEANELKIDSVDFNLKEIVSQVRDILIFKAQEKGIEFTTHILHDVPIWLHGDPLRIRQILLNLASNAIKFTDRGTVAIEVTTAMEDQNEVSALFKVKDTGIGIDEEQLEYLFQSYSQVNSEITRKYGGTGLGLAISKKLTDLMKGDIGVNSTKGIGSDFWFSLPLKKQKGTKKHQGDLVQLTKRIQTKDSGEQHELSLLLVEDDVINQKITSILLEKEGFKVTVAENGHKAIEILKNNSFDLVLMDVEMPGMNGYETTRQIRQLKSSRLDTNLPIIAMTAHAMSGDREKCISAGMNDYISKPINMHLLNEIIDRLGISRSISGLPPLTEEVLASDETAIQIKKLQKLQKEIEERFDMLVRVFLESIPQKLHAIYESIDKQCYEDLRITAHQLKGSCASFYAHKMVDLCQELETQATHPECKQSTLKPLAKQLEKEGDQVIRILNNHFRN